MLFANLFSFFQIERLLLYQTLHRERNLQIIHCLFMIGTKKQSNYSQTLINASLFLYVNVNQMEYSFCNLEHLDFVAKVPKFLNHTSASWQI